MGKASFVLALSDYLAPLLYLGGAFFLVRILRKMGERELSAMFMAGAGLAFLAGFLKASSKVLDAAASRPVTESGFLYDQMFPVMAIGFLATAVAVILGARRYSGRDSTGERTRFAESSAWISPFAAGLFLGGAIALVFASGASSALRAHFLEVKRWSMLAMIVLQLSTMGIMSWFCFREGSRAGGILAILSILAMLGTGALASPSMEARFSDRILMNWIDQSVNVAAQLAFLGAAYALWRRAVSGKVRGVERKPAGATG